MNFSSISFIYFFLPATIAIYFIVPRKLKNAVLLLASLLFYTWGEQWLTLLFVGSIASGYIFGRLIDKVNKAGSTKAGKVILGIALLWHVGLLIYFKIGIMPIGISFYTFQIMSYLIDVYRGEVKVQRNPLHLALYVAMFPQLIAGPIVRYATIEQQLVNRSHSLEKFSDGARRFILGLSKKVLIADMLGQVCQVYRQTTELSIVFSWMYAIAFMLQIYFDFSGYSDMAIGLGKIFGFTYLENFNYPYISGSVTEFWRRWHISLGSWFRDYVYIPLGGNRKGLAVQIRNIFIVWALTGLWHGMAVNFLLWGLLFAVLLFIEKLGVKKWLDDHAIIGHLYVLLVVMLGFVLFNASSMAQAGEDVWRLVAFGQLPFITGETVYCISSYAVIFLIAIIGATPLPKKLMDKALASKKGQAALTFIEPLGLVILLLLITSNVLADSFHPFLYFRF